MKEQEWPQDRDLKESGPTEKACLRNRPANLGLSTILYYPLILVALLCIYMFVHCGGATSVTGEPPRDPYVTLPAVVQGPEDRAWRNLDMPDVTLASAEAAAERAEQAPLGERSLDVEHTLQ